MSRASANEDHFVDDLPDRPISDGPNLVTGKGLALNEAAPPEDAEQESLVDDFVAEVPSSQPFAVRETRRLYRLRAARFLAIVAADSEDEARTLAAGHDALGGDWRNPGFASAEFEDTGQAHIVGDVVISAIAPPPVARPKRVG